MFNLVEPRHVMDAMVPHGEKSSLNTEGRNTIVVSRTTFYPVYASPDDVDFQREEHFEPQFFPR